MLEVGGVLKMIPSNTHSSDGDGHFTHNLLYQSSEIDGIISTLQMKKLRPQGQFSWSRTQTTAHLATKPVLLLCSLSCPLLTYGELC